MIPEIPRSGRFPSLCLSLALLAPSCACLASPGTPAPNTIALTGVTGPYGPNSGSQVFSTVLTPRVNSAGVFAFGAANGLDGHVWSGVGNTRTPIARPNDPVPNHGSAVFQTVERLGVGVDSGGATLFNAKMLNASPSSYNNVTTYFASSPGSAVSFARVFGAPGPTVFNAVSDFLSNTGTTSVAFYGDQTGAELWLGQPTSLQSVAKAGLQAPQTPSGTLFGSSMFPVDLNSGGSMLLSSDLRTSGGSSLGRALYVADSRGSALHIRSTDPAPGRPSGTTFGTIGSGSLAPNGAIGFVSTAGSYAGSLGAPRLMGFVGGSAPGAGAGVTYALLNTPLGTSAGTFVYSARLQGTGVTTTNEIAIFRDTGSGPGLIVRGGQAAAGLNAGEFLIAPTLEDRNILGQFLLQATIGGAAASSNRGVWAWDPVLGLLSVARTGDTIVLPTGTTKTISLLSDIHLSSLNAGSPIPGGSGFLTGGQAMGLACYHADFTDGSSGTFAVVVPAPAAGTFGLLIFAFVGRRRRNVNAGNAACP